MIWSWQARRLVLVALLCFSAAVQADSPDFRVDRVSSELRNGVYYLDADFSFKLGDEMREALRNGVQLVLAVDFTVTRPRRFWLDEYVAGLKQRYSLRFHALTRQYLVQNMNTGIQKSYHNLVSALDALRVLRNLPALDAGILQQGVQYDTQLRVYLDIDALPVALKVRAYTKKGWNVSSKWVKWHIP
ncbi:MAG TPA: DUF4390 domain-containing protein [Gammaproteobacteria bacterium]|nr:DUF4390 domain-containing protein [Gammaproteobacteria bacterium]